MLWTLRYRSVMYCYYHYYYYLHKTDPTQSLGAHIGRVSGRLIDKAGFVSDKVLLSALSSKLLVSTIIYSFIYYVSSFNALQ